MFNSSFSELLAHEAGLADLFLFKRRYADECAQVKASSKQETRFRRQFVKAAACKPVCFDYVTELCCRSLNAQVDSVCCVACVTTMGEEYIHGQWEMLNDKLYI